MVSLLIQVIFSILIHIHVSMAFSLRYDLPAYCTIHALSVLLLLLLLLGMH